MEPPHSTTIQPQTHQTNSTKKRPLDAVLSSRYYKMRAVLRDLRPHFDEVLRTAEFRDCHAAQEIREQLNILADLYSGMTGQTLFIGKSRNIPEGQPPTGDDHRKAPDVKPSEHPHSVGINRPYQSDTASLGNFIVGGSAFGWNFITYPGNKAAYYGVAKESFREAQAKLQGQAQASLQGQ